MIPNEPDYESISSPDWYSIDIPRWYDCMLGKMGDKKLAALTGVRRSRIRYRRELFKIPAWCAAMAIQPHSALLGIKSDAYIARLCGVSASSVKTYREEQNIPARPKANTTPKIPPSHPVRPYRTLLGLIEDSVLADLAEVSVHSVIELRELLGLEPAKPAPRQPEKPAIPNYQGPGLGYESLLSTMSIVQICRATGVPCNVIEDRRRHLGIEAYKQVSKLSQYEYLLAFKFIPSSVLAKLVGLSDSRVSEIRRKKGL